MTISKKSNNIWSLKYLLLQFLTKYIIYKKCNESQVNYLELFIFNHIPHGFQFTFKFINPVEK